MNNVFHHTISNIRDGINKDRYIILDNIFIICDGISSNSNGGESAQLVIDYCKSYKYFDKFTVELANSFIKELNDLVYKIKGGTTFTFLRFEKDEGVLIHTGDSECYIIKDDEIKELTVPFTFAYHKLYKNGHIEFKDLKTAYGSNVLIEYLGTDYILNPQLKRFKLFGNEKFILCSDGANYCEPKQMKDIVLNNKKDPAKEICEIAKKNGSRDDITTIVII